MRHKGAPLIVNAVLLLLITLFFLSLSILVSPSVRPCVTCRSPLFPQVKLMTIKNDKNKKNNT